MTPELSPKDQAKAIFNNIYAVLLEADSDLSQEIIISLVSKKLSRKAAEFFMTLVPEYEMNYWIDVRSEIEKL